MATGFGFASIAAMRSARAFAAAVAWADGTKVLVTGGASSNGPSSAELFDRGTGSWTPSEMTTARSRHTATRLNSGEVLVVGGDNSTDPSTAEVYNPNTNSWQKVFNNLNSPRRAHTATLLADGRVLVTGGLGAAGGPNLSSAEIFNPGSDPVNGSWTPVSSMNDARALHTATLLPGGVVFVAGGVSENGTFNPTFLSSAELFNPTTGTWHRTSSMNDAHVGHTATLLSSDLIADFTVLIAGGTNSLGFISSEAELYKPPPPVGLPIAEISDGSSWGSSWFDERT
jgi:Galactose oxidase, central domain/Kelch motif